RWNIRPVWYSKHEEIESLLNYLAGKIPEFLRHAANVQVTPTMRDTVPAAKDVFVGREVELDELKTRIEKQQMVSVVGSPGSGKTRLVTEVLHDIRASFDAVWFVPLSQFSDENAVPQRIATVIGVQGQPMRDLKEVIADKLAPYRQLLVLDNCEPVI